MHNASFRPITSARPVTVLTMTTPLSLFAAMLDNLETATDIHAALSDPDARFANPKVVHEAGDIDRSRALHGVTAVMLSADLSSQDKYLRMMCQQILLLLRWEATDMAIMVEVFGCAMRSVASAKEGSPCHNQLSRGLALIDHLIEQQATFLGLIDDPRRATQKQRYSDSVGQPA